MRGVHTYAILLGFAIGMGAFLALRMPPVAVVLGIGSTIMINEAMKKRHIENLRREQKRFEKRDDE
jgi:hypothetical protein